MLVITVVPYKTFKQKIKLVKEFENRKAKVEILGNLIYIEENFEEVYQ